MADTPVWDDGRAVALPSLDHDISTDCCVIGLGGSGLVAVRELLALGKRVVAIDAGTIGGGAAGRNGGFLLAGVADFYHDAVAMHGAALVRTLYQHTLDEIDVIDRDTPGVVRRTGSLRIAIDDLERADCDAQFDAMRADNLPVEHYRGPEGDGLLFPRDAAFNPLLRCRRLAERAQAEGALLFERTPAVEIRSGEVITPHATIRCEEIFVAVDGKLELLIPELAGQVRTARLQMLATAPVQPGLIPRPVYCRWGYDYWQQLPDGRVAVGGCRDLAGDVEWTPIAEVTADMQARLESLLRQRVGVHAPIEARWAGLVGYSTSGLPVLAEVRPGVWAAGGYNGTGNLIGALAGRAMVQLAVQGRPELADCLRGGAATLAPPRRSGDVTTTSDGART